MRGVVGARIKRVIPLVQISLIRRNDDQRMLDFCFLGSHLKEKDDGETERARGADPRQPWPTLWSKCPSMCQSDPAHDVEQKGGPKRHAGRPPRKPRWPKTFRRPGKTVSRRVNHLIASVGQIRPHLKIVG